VNQVDLRSARADDAEPLARFWSVAAENDARPPDRPELILRLVRHDPDAIIVAEVEGRIVGTIVAGWDGWRASLYRLAVHPDHRRQGLGRLLLTAAEDRLRALGAERFHAMVLDGNDQGRAVWQRAGYVAQDEWSRWVRSADLARD